jgi:hypothetical protein
MPRLTYNSILGALLRNGSLQSFSVLVSDCHIYYIAYFAGDNHEIRAEALSRLRSKRLLMINDVHIVISDLILNVVNYIVVSVDPPGFGVKTDVQNVGLGFRALIAVPAELIPPSPFWPGWF